jgi:hypothetical protein
MFSPEFRGLHINQAYKSSIMPPGYRALAMLTGLAQRLRLRLNNDRQNNKPITMKKR